MEINFTGDSSSGNSDLNVSDLLEEKQSLASQLFAYCDIGPDDQGVLQQLTDFRLDELDLNTLTNSVGESPLLVATKNGNVEILTFLISKGASPNITNKNGETPLMVSLKAGHTEAAKFFIEQKVDLNAKNENNETALHLAARDSDGLIAESLVLAGADINAKNSKGCTSLHLACQKRNIPVACVLIHLGADINITNQQQETSLHEACKEGLIPVVQLMCSKECSVNISNKTGFTALHFASKSGKVEIIRSLLLAGADIDAFNKDGLRAEDIALAQGHSETAELLSRLSSSIATDQCRHFVKQLTSKGSKLDCLKVKIFGNQGVGKSTLIDSLKCGYLWSLVKKVYWNTGSNNNLPAPTDPLKAWIPSPLENYTKGIDVQQTSVPGVGNLSIWEFSGFEPYSSYYDHFVGDPSCIHIVTFNALDDLVTRRNQIFFWLNFIKARIAPSEPIGLAGIQLWAPHVLFVATHASDDNCSKNEDGSYVVEGWPALISEIRAVFDFDLIILPKTHVLNAQQANSVGMRDLRNTIGKLKEFLTEYLGKSMDLLVPTVKELPNWVKMLGSSCPVVNWSSFMEYIRIKINILATEDHIKELVNQLQIAGEVLYLEATGRNQENLIVLNPRWLTTQILGKVLSYETIEFSPNDGRFTPETLNLLFPEIDLPDLKNILQSLDLCLESVYPGGQVFYDFPALDFSPHPLNIWDDWPLKQNVEKTKKTDTKLMTQISNEDSQNTQSEIWHGIQLGSTCPNDGSGMQLNVIYPRLALAVRRALAEQAVCPSVVREVRQWGTGIRVDCDNFATVIAVSVTQQHIDIITRGFKGHEMEMFKFSEFLFHTVFSKIQQTCPGLSIQRYAMSSYDLSLTPAFDQNNEQSDTNEPTENSKTYYVRVYDSREIIEAQLKQCISPVTGDKCSETDFHSYVVNKKLEESGNKSLPTDKSPETEKLLDLLAFGSEEVFSSLILGRYVHISQLPVHARCTLAQLLDDSPENKNSITGESNSGFNNDLEKPDSSMEKKKKWRDLANYLGVSDSIMTQKEETANKEGKVTIVPVSKTDAVLALWSYQMTATIENLAKAFKELDRLDAFDVLLRSAPMFIHRQTTKVVA